MAVAFFFILGGFCMTLGYKDRAIQPGFNYRQYITRRCIKFYPLHWLCLLAFLPMVGLPHTLKQGVFMGINASLLQTLFPYRGIYFSYNAVSWYLANTVLYTIVFPPFFKWLFRTSPKGRVCFAVFLLLIYASVAVLIPTKWYHYVLYVNPFMRFTDFVLGIYLALYYLKIKDHPENFAFLKKGVVGHIAPLLLIAVLMLESCLFQMPMLFISPLFWPLSALLILATSLGECKALDNPVLHRIGELSFTIFMIHLLVLRYITMVFSTLNIESPLFYVIITLFLTLVLSDITELFILKPVTQWLTKYFLPSTTTQ